MLFSPLNYDEPVFRPPAEAYSAIVQATIGCSWNRCAFCEMYTTKQFRIRKFEDIQQNIRTLARLNSSTRKIFLADGNAFVLSTNRLLSIVEEINTNFPKIQRISSYALPGDIASKTLDELKAIHKAGLKLLYIGIETGDDELLKLIDKSETYSSTIEGINKAHEAGIETSVMVLNGLGGKQYSQQHAIKSAEVINQAQPKFLSTLTLSLPYGQKHFEKRFSGEYIPMTIVELAEELKMFLTNLELQNTIFRSDHVSNNLVLKGRLGIDKEKLLKAVDETILHTHKDEFPAAPGML